MAWTKLAEKQPSESAKETDRGRGESTTGSKKLKHSFRGAADLRHIAYPDMRKRHCKSQ